MRGHVPAVSVMFGFLCLVAPALGQAPCNQSMPVSVLEIDSGEVLTDLSASQFRVTLGGTRVNVVSAQRDYGRRNLVLVFDLNGGAWETQRRDALDLLKSLGTKHRVAMIAFAKNGWRQLGFDAGTESISQWLATVEAGKGELQEEPAQIGFLDAVHRAAGLLPSGEFGSAIIVFGPSWLGYPNQRGWKELQRELAERDIRLFALTSGGDELERVAAYTGGLIFRWDQSIEGVNLVLSPVVAGNWALDSPSWVDGMVLSQVLTPYKLDLRLDRAPRPGARWNVEILNAQKGGKRKGLYVVFPRGTEYCQPPGKDPAQQ